MKPSYLAASAGIFVAWPSSFIDGFVSWESEDTPEIK